MHSLSVYCPPTSLALLLSSVSFGATNCIYYMQEVVFIHEGHLGQHLSVCKSRSIEISRSWLSTFENVFLRSCALTILHIQMSLGMKVTCVVYTSIQIIRSIEQISKSQLPTFCKWLALWNIFKLSFIHRNVCLCINFTHVGVYQH